MSRQVTMRYLFLLLVLSSCNPYNLGVQHTVTYAGYEHIVLEVMQEWRSDPTLPVIKSSSCNLDNLYVAFPNDQQFTENSTYCPPNACLTCTTSCAAAYFLPWTRYRDSRSEYYIVLAAALIEPERENAIRHETLHWLSMCTSHDNTLNEAGGYLYYYGNITHSDPRLWGPGGILSRLGL